MAETKSTMEVKTTESVIEKEAVRDALSGIEAEFSHALLAVTALREILQRRGSSGSVFRAGDVGDVLEACINEAKRIFEDSFNKRCAELGVRVFKDQPEPAGLSLVV
jgi:hypothetical protein